MWWDNKFGCIMMFYAHGMWVYAHNVFMWLNSNQIFNIMEVSGNK